MSILVYRVTTSKVTGTLRGYLWSPQLVASAHPETLFRLVPAHLNNTVDLIARFEAFAPENLINKIPNLLLWYLYTLISIQRSQSTPPSNTPSSIGSTYAIRRPRTSIISYTYSWTTMCSNMRTMVTINKSEVWLWETNWRHPCNHMHGKIRQENCLQTVPVLLFLHAH